MNPALRTFPFTFVAATTMSAASQLLFIGTYTPKESESRGIYVVRLDSETGALSPPVLAAATPNPTFLALNPDRPIVYALDESEANEGKRGGAAAAFAYADPSGKLSLLNLQSAGGENAAYIGIDPAGRTLVTISYHGGQITSFPLTPDGKIGPRRSFITSTGTLGPRSDRQDRPHPHSVTYSPDNRFAYVCDLGRDKILRFRLDSASATLTPAGDFTTAPGAGPRHSKFSADGRFLYVINELNGTIAVYDCDPSTGDLKARQTVGTLPEDFKESNTTAEIRIHPNGRFVYGSNRGHDSLAVFARNSTDGTLTRIQIVSSGGVQPRNFNLSPDGNWLVCANRESNNLVVFKVDAKTGQLTATGHQATVPQAVCVLFAPDAK